MQDLQRKINILLVDDTPANLVALAAVLDNPKYQLILAHSGKEALENLREREFAVILLDVQMPEMDGFETARRIRALSGSKDTPIIFVTAIYRERKFIQSGYAAGGVDYLFKPIDVDIVRSKVAIFADLFIKNKMLQAQQERTARLVAVQRITTDTLTHALKADQAITEVLREICKNLEWDMGTYWSLDDVQNVLRCKYFWSAPSCPPAFISEILSEVFGPGIGVPGRTWLGNRAVWAKEGLGSAVAFPIPVEGKVKGVMEFFCREPQMEDLDLLKIMTAVGSQVGQFMARMDALFAAERALQLRDEFLAMASHELKTPLTVLSLQAQINCGRLEKNDPTVINKDEISKYLKITINQVDRMINLVENMFDVSRIATGKLAMMPESLDLGEMVKGVAEGFMDHVKAKGSNLVLNINPEIVGQWDRFRLEQVVANLITNAMKYGDGGPIEISVVADSGVARVSVRDFGPGIAAEDLDRIFGRFERVQGSRTSNGLGLGLYISRQIAIAHNGRLWVKSEVGKGSTFILELPLEISKGLTVHAGKQQPNSYEVIDQAGR